MNLKKVRLELDISDIQQILKKCEVPKMN